MHVVPLAFTVDDPSQLISDTYDILKKYSKHFNEHIGINFKKPYAISRKDELAYGCGSLSQYSEVNLVERDFNTLTEQLADMYIAHTVIPAIERFTVSMYGIAIGRARLMVLRPKSCLTWHVDREKALRFHIPIITNSSCMFIHQESTKHPVVGQMKEIGRLYSFNSSVYHTAINASREDRVHLVLSGYSDD